jgi:hypothetical protein
MPFVSSVRGAYGPQDKKTRQAIANLVNADAIKNIPEFYRGVATGGTITLAGGYVIHTFTSTGNSIFNTSASVSGMGTTSVEYLVVAGGAGGGGRLGGGGGAGGMRTGTLSTPATSYTITVGSGRTNSSVNGDNSTFSSITSTGGGRGGIDGPAGSPGGSGGGASFNSPPAGSGTPGQGTNGGNCGNHAANGAGTFPANGGGGGGAGSG